MLLKFVKISEIIRISVFFEETNGHAKARPYPSTRCFLPDTY